MALKATIETIGEFTATGVGRVSMLGNQRPPGQFNNIGDKLRIFQFTGIAGGTLIDIEGSLDNSNWVKWAEGIDADTAIMIDDGPVYMRANCTTYGSGTAQVLCQKFINE